MEGEGNQFIQRTATQGDPTAIERDAPVGATTDQTASFSHGDPFWADKNTLGVNQAAGSHPSGCNYTQGVMPAGCPPPTRIPKRSLTFK